MIIHSGTYQRLLCSMNLKTQSRDGRKTRQHLQQEQQITEKTEEHISVVSVGIISKGGQSSVRSSRSSTASSSRCKAEAERAALLVQAEGLKKKLALEREEAEMIRKGEEIKAQKEILTLETQLAAANAKIKVYDEMDGRSSVHSKQKENVAKLGSTLDRYDKAKDDDDDDGDGFVVDGGMKGSHVAAHRPMSNSSASCGQQLHTQAKSSKTKLQQAPVPNNDKHVHNERSPDADLLKIMQKQNEITEMLIKEQRLSTLPSKEIPVFKGNPLQYMTFIRTFEHCIEYKTSNDRDRLFFLDQFTEGQPKVLVRSCLHMEHNKGVQQSKAIVATTLWK